MPDLSFARLRIELRQQGFQSAARVLHQSQGRIERGLGGRPEVPVLRVYTSELAHSSVEKAAIALHILATA